MRRPPTPPPSPATTCSTSKGSSGEWTIKVSPGTDTSTTIDSLDNGQPYDVQVRAISEAGSGGWSDSTTGTPVAQKPDAPNPPRLIPGNGQLEVSWTKPAENGAPITEYKVQHRLTTEQRLTLQWDVQDPWGRHPLHHHHRRPRPTASSYDVQVLAVSLAGNSDWSDSTARALQSGRTALTPPTRRD